MLSDQMQEALDSPDVGNFAKMIIIAGADRDIVDVLFDLELAHHLFELQYKDKHGDEPIIPF